MAKLIVNCDEKFPVFDLEIPEEGQIANCEIDEGFYREYLYISLAYSKIQRKLKEIYEDSQRSFVKQSCGIRFQQGSVIDDEYEFNQTANASQEEL